MRPSLDDIGACTRTSDTNHVIAARHVSCDSVALSVSASARVAEETAPAQVSNEKKPLTDARRSAGS